MASDDNRRRWDQYKFLTREFDRESDELRPFSQDELEATVVPEGWDSADETRRLDEEFVSQVVDSDSPFDRPQPPIRFVDCDFVFTGKFEFGSRKACEAAVASRGGRALKGVSGQVEYLVVGSLGSPAWSRGSYGSKIEEAVLLRREHGRPAIVSEEHWVAALELEGEHA